VHTHVLLSELRKCDGLVQRDLRYAHLVAGASKMPLGMVWTARNQEDQCIKDTDLAALRDVARAANLVASPAMYPAASMTYLCSWRDTGGVTAAGCTGALAGLRELCDAVHKGASHAQRQRRAGSKAS
jgi:uncharacterized protein YmfQ (DUF2313 family)